MKVNAQWVPCQLSDEHMHQQMAATIEFLTLYDQEGEAIIQRIITGDKIWIPHYTPSTKWQSMAWKWSDESGSKKFKSPIVKIISPIFKNCNEHTIIFKDDVPIFDSSAWKKNFQN